MVSCPRQLAEAFDSTPSPANSHPRYDYYNGKYHRLHAKEYTNKCKVRAVAEDDTGIRVLYEPTVAGSTEIECGGLLHMYELSLNKIQYNRDPWYRCSPR